MNPTAKRASIVITAGFNNTLIVLTDKDGHVLRSESAGSAGFKGAKKSTPYAATSTAEKLAKKALSLGVQSVDVFVKGPGMGRNSAVKGLKAGGLEVASLADVTPMPHNGPRPKKRRRT